MFTRNERRELVEARPRRSGRTSMALRLTIDGRLVARGRADRGCEQCDLYLFHEYGNWTLLTVTSQVDGDGGQAGSGSASVRVECHGSFDDVLAAVHADGPDVRRHALRDAFADARG